MLGHFLSCGASFINVFCKAQFVVVLFTTVFTCDDVNREKKS